MSTVQFIGNIDTLALPAGPQGVPGPSGPTGPAGKDGVSPTIDMQALAKAVAAILAAPPVVTPPPVITPPPVVGGAVAGRLQVVGTQILNPDGTEFRIRGVDICHYDSNWPNGIGNSGANAIRLFMPNDATKLTGYIQKAWGLSVVPIACMAQFPVTGYKATSGDNSAADLVSAVDWWVTNAPALKDLHPLIINVANEWLSGQNAALWHSSYVLAISRLRAAGYTQPIMIDTDGYGQDYNTLATDAPAVLDSDPLKNVCFGYHLYGQTSNAAAMTTNFDKMNDNGICVVVAEFGPGRNIGPSPTSITPAQVEQAAEANNEGWLAWAWDDNNLANAKADDNWFSMTTGNPGGVGAYDGVTASQLTQFGQTMVPLLKSLAVKSTMFTK